MTLQYKQKWMISTMRLLAPPIQMQRFRLQVTPAQLRYPNRLHQSSFSRCAREARVRRASLQTSPIRDRVVCKSGRSSQLHPWRLPYLGLLLVDRRQRIEGKCHRGRFWARSGSQQGKGSSIKRMESWLLLCEGRHSIDSEWRKHVHVAL